MLNVPRPLLSPAQCLWDVWMLCNRTHTQSQAIIPRSRHLSVPCSGVQPVARLGLRHVFSPCTAPFERQLKLSVRLTRFEWGPVTPARPTGGSELSVKVTIRINDPWSDGMTVRMMACAGQWTWCPALSSAIESRTLNRQGFSLNPLSRRFETCALSLYLRRPSFLNCIN